LQLPPGGSFDPAGFDAFLAEQSDLGTKWAPRYVRISDDLPVTQTNKVIKRALRKEHWECADPVWWKPAKGDPYRRLDPRDIAQLREHFAERGRSAALDTL
jgi:fatty-acyl-CoA synthase